MVRGIALVILLMCAAGRAYAQEDLTGEWLALNTTSEDGHVRIMPGPALGDYTGLPLNAAGRQKARTWNAAILSQPEEQAKPHPVQYSLRGGGGPNLRIAKVIDPVTFALVAYTVTGLYGRADRTIWMDGRPHPSSLAEHTFDGFSTGEWEGTALKVTTTHMKLGYIQRNGAPASSESRMVERWIRHGSNLMVFTWVDDPIYYEEPFVRTTNWVLNTRQHVGNPILFEPVDELGNKELGWVPSWPLGTLHEEFSEQYNLPLEGTQGGKETLYPEFILKIEAFRRERARSESRKP